MLKRLWAFFRRKPQPPATMLDRIAVDRKTGITKVDKTRWSTDEVEAFQAAALQHADLPLFTGLIEHGYGLTAVGTAERCPQCGAATQQQYANFIYATNVATRVMFVPAGYFCSRCPTVIVDEALIRGGIVGKFRYEGVVGLDYDKKKPPEPFRTWNGKPTVVVYDEESDHLSLGTMPPTPRPQSKVNHAPKNRRRQEKAARRRNRPKR